VEDRRRLHMAVELIRLLACVQIFVSLAQALMPTLPAVMALVRIQPDWRPALITSRRAYRPYTYSQCQYRRDRLITNPEAVALLRMHGLIRCLTAVPQCTRPVNIAVQYPTRCHYKAGDTAGYVSICDIGCDFAVDIPNFLVKGSAKTAKVKIPCDLLRDVPI